MGRIFISHSSKNNAEAVALRDVLVAAGFDDLFLDLDPDRGITGGQVWERALATAADRCEAVIILASREWLASDWCRREAHYADKLNKRIFAVLIDDLRRAELPLVLTSKWQVVDLVGGNDSKMFSPVRPDGTLERTVLFSESGLRRLINGLTSAGLDPRTFTWPPANDPERSPYPGLRPLEAEDAGVFFGREAPTIAILDRLRGLREAAPPRFLVVLGASGAGKSSFLRAGVLPRLARDDRNFVVLPIVRPARAALFGETGLLPALETALKPLNIARAEIRKAIEAGAPGIRPLLSALVEARRIPPMPGEPELPPPALVLTIDQGEELFSADGRQEGAALLAILRDLLLQPGGDGSAAEPPAPEVIAITSIRSDAYEALQTAPALSGIRQEAMSLAPLPRGAYQEVIEGPARRVRDAGRELTIEPALTEALLADIGSGDAKDALPLLAFTLEWIFREYRAHGALRLDDYRALGGIRGSIEAAVAQVMKEADANPAVPKDRAAREVLLRRVLIPWLAMVDPDAHKPRRRVARLSEIPEEARPLLSPLLGARLLATDLASEDGEKTVELAHEALLRQWSLLEGWLIEDGALLATAEEVKRAASDWKENGHHSDWLAHAGGRLEEAERVVRRPDLAAYVGPEGIAYVSACRKLEDERAAEEEKRRRMERLGLVGALCLAAIAIVGGGVALHFAGEAEAQATNAVRNETTSIAALARVALSDGRPADAVALALAAWPRTSQESRPQLRRTLQSLSTVLSLNFERVRMIGHRKLISSASFSSDDSRVITASADDTARIWDAATGRVVAVLQHDGDVNSATFSPDGKHVVTASGDRTARIWDAKSGQLVVMLRHGDSVKTAAFSSSDTSLVVTASADDTARIWDAATGRMVAVLQHDGDVNSATFSPDGRRVLTASADDTARIWDAATGRAVAVFQHDGDVNSATFSPDDKQVVTASGDRTARIWEAAPGVRSSVVSKHEGTVWGTAFSPKGEEVVTASDDRTARVWNWRTGNVIVLRGHQEAVTFASFSPDGRRVVTASEDGTARVWSSLAGEEMVVLHGHESRVNSAIFSTDGSKVVTASEDRTARVWEIPAVDSARIYAHEEPIRAIAFAVDGKHLVTASSDHTARIWDVATRTEIVPRLRHDKGVNSAAFSTNGKQVVTASDDETAWIWNATTGTKEMCLCGHRDKVNSAAFSPDGSLVVTASDDSTARTWDAKTGTEIAEFRGNKEAKLWARFSPDGSRVVTAGNDDVVWIWDSATGTGRVPLHGHGNRVNWAEFSPDNSRVVTASNDDTVRIWDAATGRTMAVFRHDGDVNSAAFSRDGTLVVSASDDESARIWQLATELQIAVLRGPGVNGDAVFSPDSRTVVTTNEGKVVFWDISNFVNVDLLQRACMQIRYTVKLSEVAVRYDLEGLPPICGDVLPLPIDAALLK